MELSPTQKARLILSIVLVFCVMIVLWVFVISRGTLIITAEPVYDLELNGKSQKKCLQNPCKLRLAPGTYNTTFKKTNFFDHQEQIEIKLLRQTHKKIEFSLIPKIEYVSDYPFPKYQNLNREIKINFQEISLLVDSSKIALSGLPPKIEKISFSESASKAILFSKIQIYLFDAQKTEISPLEIAHIQNFSWFPDETGIAYLKKESSEKYQGIYFYSFENKRPILAAYLNSEIINSLIKVSHSADEAIISNLDDIANYLVNFSQKLRQKITFSKKITKIIFSPDDQTIIFISTNKGLSKAHIYHRKNAKIIEPELEFNHENIAFQDNRKAIVALEPKQELIFGNPNGPQTVINLALNKGYGQTSKKFYELDLSNGNLVEIPIQSKENFILKPERIEITETGKEIYFLQEGKIYKIKR